jgi:hypothetical protein
MRVGRQLAADSAIGRSPANVSINTTRPAAPIDERCQRRAIEKSI